MKISEDLSHISLRYLFVLLSLNKGHIGQKVRFAYVCQCRKYDANTCLHLQQIWYKKPYLLQLWANMVITVLAIGVNMNLHYIWHISKHEQLQFFV